MKHKGISGFPKVTQSVFQFLVPLVTKPWYSLWFLKSHQDLNVTGL